MENNNNNDILKETNDVNNTSNVNIKTNCIATV
jgi:hypothetical protein